MAMWTGTNFWGYGAVPNTAANDPEDRRRNTKEWVAENYWPYHLTATGNTTEFTNREGRRDAERRVFAKQDLGSTGRVRNESEYGETSPSGVAQARLGSKTGVDKFQTGVGEQYGYSGKQTDEWLRQMETREWRSGSVEGETSPAPPSPEFLGEPSPGGLARNTDPYAYGPGETPMGTNYGEGQLESTLNSFDQTAARQEWGKQNFNNPSIVDAWSSNPSTFDLALAVMPQPGDRIFGGESRETSEGGKVTGWIKDAASGEYTGTRPDGSMYRSKTKPAIAEGIERRTEPQSQAGLLRDYNNNIFDSIQGYYNQARAQLDREFQASYPKYTQPGPKEFGMSTEQYNREWRVSQTAGGTRPSKLSGLSDQYNASYDKTLAGWNKNKFEAINTMETARDKALSNAEQSAMSRNYNLEKQLLAARNKPMSAFTQHGSTRKALQAAESLAKFSQFIHPKKSLWMSREGEQKAAIEGRSKWVVDETSMPPGTSPEYISMARQATDLLNSYYSGTSTYEQVTQKAMGFEKSNIAYEQAALRNQQGLFDSRVQRERQEAAPTRTMPEDAGSLLFGTAERPSTGGSTPPKAAKAKSKSEARGKGKKKKEDRY